MTTARTLLALVLLLATPVALAQDDTPPAAEDTEPQPIQVAPTPPPRVDADAPPEQVAPPAPTPQPPFEAPEEPGLREYAAAIFAKYGAVLLLLTGGGIYLLGKRLGWWRRARRALRRVRERLDVDRRFAAEDDDRARRVSVRTKERVEDGIDAGAPKPGFGEVRRGDDPHEILIDIQEDPDFLRDAIQAFADQDDGAEQLRQFCEDYTFEAKTPETVEEVFLLPVTDDLIKHIPPEVLYQTKSRRSQARAPPIVLQTQPATAPPTSSSAPAAKPKRSGPVPKGEPLAPPRDAPQESEGQ